MKETTVPVHSDEAMETSTGLDHRKLLIWAFLASECFFFGSLLATYLVYRNSSLVGPFPEEIFDIPVTSVSTFVLLTSSLAMVLALAAIRRGDQRGAKVWLFTTAILGLTFLGFQGFEFYEFGNHERVMPCTPGLQVEECLMGATEYPEPYGLTPRTNIFGSTFFVLTGFHGAHVTVGVIWLLSLWIMALRGELPQRENLKVELAGLYWHFVDIVWIVIFTVVYLLGA